MKKKCKSMKKNVIKHLKDDMKTFKEESSDDKKLLKKLSSKKDEKKESRKEEKIEKVMREYKDKKLHSGSKKGPLVKNKKQAIAIALNEARRMKKRKK